MVETDSEKLSDVKTCPVCESDMVQGDFNGDWRVLKCSNDECSTKIESPIGNPKGEGFTMESLKRASEYADEEE